MSITQCFTKSQAVQIARVVVLSAFALGPVYAFGQMPIPATQPPSPGQATATQDTQAQITKLQQQVIQLQTALKQSKGRKASSQSDPMNSGKPAMGMGDDAGGMGGMSSGATKPPMKDKMGGMEGMDKMSSQAAPMAPKGCCGKSMGMPMPKGGMADDKMGKMPSSAATRMKSKPMTEQKMAEVPHLLHVGATDFFLDHQQHLGITPDQKALLETIKRDASNQKTNSEGEIDKAEEQLWQLTSADQPNGMDIDSKVQEVAQLRAAEQVAFIHSVSAASNVLTSEQRVEAVKPMIPSKGSMSKMPKAPTTAPMKMK